MAFATWISPEFQLYIMKDYRRLKQDENSRFSLDWNLNRALSKVNYRIPVSYTHLLWVLAIIGAVAAIAGIAFAVYRFFAPDYLEDFEEDFDDDFDDYFEDEEE